MRHEFVENLGRLARNRPLGWVLSATLFPLLNAFLSLAARHRIPFFMDSIFTALAAAVFGPWQGLLVAFLTNVGHEAFSGFSGVQLPFAICGMATALIVSGYVGRGRYRNPLNAVLCVAVVAFANSLLGAAIATWVFGGGTGVNVDAIVAGFAMVMNSIFEAAFFARVAINLVDKAIAVIPALLLAAALGLPDARRTQLRAPATGLEA
jgi:energy-coupling factor transport system substrate-specific component